MNSPDLFKAEGVPCAFKKYYLSGNNGWQEVLNGILKSNQRIILKPYTYSGSHLYYHLSFFL
jgi:hypothetical protein